MQEDRNRIGLRLLNMVTSFNVEEICAKISDCIQQLYHFDGIGFFLWDTESFWTHFHSETVPREMIHALEKTLRKSHHKIEKTKNFAYFEQKQSELIGLNPKEYHDPGEPMAIALPLRSEERTMGALAFIGKPETIKDVTTETSALSTFVSQIAGLLTNAMSHESKDKKIQMLTLYQTISSALSYIGSLQELLTTIVDIVTSEIPCEECSVLFYDSDNHEFEFFTAAGETGMNLMKRRFSADKGIAGLSLREQEAQVVNDVQNHPEFYKSIDEEYDFQTKSILAVPIIAGEEPVGILNAINKSENKSFNKHDDQILSAIADEVALAVKNARLFECVVDSYCKIKQGLNSCKNCKRPLKTWTPCAKYLDMV